MLNIRLKPNSTILPLIFYALTSSSDAIWWEKNRKWSLLPRGLCSWGNTWHASRGLETHLWMSKTTGRIIIAASKNALTARFKSINWIIREKSSGNLTSVFLFNTQREHMNKYWVKWATQRMFDGLLVNDGWGVGWWPVCHWSFNPTNGAFSPTGPSLQRADGELMGCELIKSNPASSHQSSCITICWQLPPNPYLAHQ